MDRLASRILGATTIAFVALAFACVGAPPDGSGDSAEGESVEQAATTNTCTCSCVSGALPLASNGSGSAPDWSWSFPGASSCPPAGSGACSGYVWLYGFQFGPYTGSLTDCSWGPADAGGEGGSSEAGK